MATDSLIQKSERYGLGGYDESKPNNNVVEVVYLKEEEYNSHQIAEVDNDLKHLDKDLSKEKYQDIKAGVVTASAFAKPFVYAKHTQLYKREQAGLSNNVGQLLGSFKKYGDLPAVANEGDIAYNETLSGALFLKKTGIYQYTDGTWVLVKHIL